MSIISKLALGIVGLSMVAAAGVSAEEATRPMIVADLKAQQGKPGDCKRSYATAVGLNPATAQAIWVATVNAQYGSNWAHWVGAKNKAIVPQGTQFQARAMPCFYNAVPGHAAMGGTVGATRQGDPYATSNIPDSIPTFDGAPASPPGFFFACSPEPRK